MKEFNPSNEKTAVNECGITMYFIRIKSTKEKSVATMEVIKQMVLLLNIL